MILCLSLLFACKPIVDYPITPTITFKDHSIEKLTSGGQPSYKLHITVGFTDGDGDIGLSENHNAPPFDPGGKYYYNLFVAYYEKINGEYRQLTRHYPFEFGDTINYNGRLPVITPNSKHKGVEGDIDYIMDMGTGPLASDRVKLRIWLYDRQLHKSNEVESPEIVFN